jgi:2-C-methyl-D-erythritol 2,4-cyclodiphosphate synthase
VGAVAISTGIGYDAHRLAEGRRFVLGGVHIPWDRGPEGHSDADVLVHAVMDALLGAAGLGDIGEHFPDSDPAYAGADSIELLRDVVALLGRREILQVDTTILLEQPKIGPHRESIRDSIAGALRVGPDRVNIKATTGEGMGFIGRQEGVAALAVATLGCD